MSALLKKRALACEVAGFMLAAGMTLFPFNVFSESNFVLMTIKITVEEPPCTINNGEQIDVAFGDKVGVNKVNGINYRVPINYQIACKDGDRAITLSLSGTAAGFDNQSLQTDIADLGIRLYQDDKPFPPNSTVKVDPASPPRLEAVPVKKAGASLTEGAFEAWATLRADYQ
ncbi:fimbrial protein [Enterobacter bugandensis]|uniref:fimbrial protein n=1 Tax=Enterobacter bugandensis TaxID=881260 RepID=UPI0021D3C2E6